MNNNYELISYKAYPDDQYTKAIAKVRIDKKYVITFVLKPTKVEGGRFWTSPSVQVNESGEKKYISSFMMDSRSEEAMLIEFIEEAVKKHSHSQVQMSGSAFVAPQATQGGGSPDEPLPF